jgi:hypothetical protein
MILSFRLELETGLYDAMALAARARWLSTVMTSHNDFWFSAVT